jgi:D-sedoheptulose 7-phosphate isomerase
MYKEDNKASAFARNYFSHLADIFGRMDCDAIGEVMEVILDARQKGKKIYFIGNGGSAATASHFANDIAIGTRCAELPFKAISLTDNVAILTALGNDEGYETIFRKQLELFVEDGDLLVAISASGNSPNIIECVEYAKNKGNKVIGLTGFEGGKLKELSDYNIHVPTDKGEYGPVEDLHMIVDHLFNCYFYRYVRENV